MSGRSLPFEHVFVVVVVKPPLLGRGLLCFTLWTQRVATPDTGSALNLCVCVCVCSQSTNDRCVTQDDIPDVPLTSVGALWIGEEHLLLLSV